MDSTDVHVTLREVLRLAHGQHGLVTFRQLRALGLGPKAIAHRVRTGKLHRVRRGVYAVGWPHLTREGQLMAAVLACGPGAVLSNDSAAELWAIRTRRSGPIEVMVPASRRPRAQGVHVHRRRTLPAQDVTRRRGIPVTKIVRTLIDLAARLPRGPLEAAVNEADKLDLIHPPQLRAELDRREGQPGVAPLRKLLDRRTFRLTRSELERLFLPVARRAGLPTPLTRQWLNGFEVDFFWPDLGLVVESDGLRYHRTPAEQARDRLRDQAHAAAGLTPVRFTHEQVAFERAHVEAVLAAVAPRLRGQRQEAVGRRLRR